MNEKSVYDYLLENLGVPKDREKFLEMSLDSGLLFLCGYESWPNSFPRTFSRKALRDGNLVSIIVRYDSQKKEWYCCPLPPRLRDYPQAQINSEVYAFAYANRILKLNNMKDLFDFEKMIVRDKCNCH